MPTLEEIIPGELRERLQTAASKPRLPRPNWLTDGGRDYRDRAEHACAANEAVRLNVVAATRDALAWLHTALISGQVIATAFPAGAGLEAPRARIAPARWHGLRYDAGRNAAIDRATQTIVATGIAFEPANTPNRRRGRPAAERTENAEAEAQLLAAARGLTRAEFRTHARRVMPRAKTVEVDAMWRASRNSGEKIPAKTGEFLAARRRV